MITADTIRRITGFRAEGLPVVSVYLGVPGQGARSTQRERVERLLHQIRPLADDESLGRRARQSLRADLRRIEDTLSRRDEPTALFTCAGASLLETIALPRPVRDRIVVDATPYVRPMEAVLDEYPRCCVVVLNKGIPLLWEYAQGELRSAGVFRADEMLPGYELLVVGANLIEVSDFFDELPYEVRKRVGGTFTVGGGTTTENLRRHVEAAVERYERDADGRRVAEILATVAKGDLAALGLPQCLKAGSIGAIRQLLLQEGATAAGVVCDACGWLGLSGKECAACWCPVRRADNVLDDLVETVIDQGGSIRRIREKTPLAVWTVAAALHVPMPLELSEIRTPADVSYPTGPTMELVSGPIRLH
jgi:peptide chain release factor subunit 1